MRRFVPLLLFLCAFLNSAFGSEDKRRSAEALFTRSNAVLGVGQPASGPYTLRGHFRLYAPQPIEGSLARVVLRERDVWRTDVGLSGYSETVLRNLDKKWVRRSASSTPFQIEELLAALQRHLEVHKSDTVEKISEEKGGTRTECVKLSQDGSHQEVCLDSSSGLPLSVTDWDALGQRRVDYESYSNVDGKEFPTKMLLTDNGKTVAELLIDSISTGLPDNALFSPLSNAKVWPVCDNMRPPTPISTPYPLHDEKAEGAVSIHLIIDEQGHTSDIAVNRTSVRNFASAPNLDSVAIATVAKWRFKPAMCGDTPVPLETSIDVSFSVLQ